jgi:hemolysin activation/secretion protein
VANSETFNAQNNIGVHYHADFLTPYWNPDSGFKLDATYAVGAPILNQPETTNQVMGQISWAHKLPSGLGFFSDTIMAYRVYGAAATPTNAMLFSLGGNLLFRGFDLSERQGSAMWVGSIEWRVPVIKDVEWDAVDHVAGLRNLFLVPFCDVGNAYLNESPLGADAVAVGIGIRADVSWFSFLERTTLRLDIAKTVNSNSPWQFWLGMQNPF